jgi:hypothetical protein
MRDIASLKENTACNRGNPSQYGPTDGTLTRTRFSDQSQGLTGIYFKGNIIQGVNQQTLLPPKTAAPGVEMDRYPLNFNQRFLCRMVCHILTVYRVAKSHTLFPYTPA